MGSKKSFSARLSMNILLITSILFIVAIGIAAVSSHLLIADEATKSAEHLLDATIADIERTLQGVEHSVKSVAWMVGEQKDDADALYHLTQQMVRTNELIIGSAVAFVPDYRHGMHWFSPYSYLADDGSIRSKQLGGEGYDYFTMEWFTCALNSDGCWTEPYYDEGGGEELMTTYSLPIRDADGNVYAVFTADISLEWVTGYLATIKPYERSHVSLVSRQGNYINVRSDARLQGATIYSTLDGLGTRDRGIREVVDSMMAGLRGVMPYARGGRVSFAVFGPLSNGWVASITCDYEEVLARTSKMHLVLILVGLFGLLILTIVCYLIIRKLTRPLSEFTASALSIAKGNFSTPLPEIKTEDEIRELRDSFDYMQHSLTTYIDDLRNTTATNERYESELSIARNIQMAMVPRNFESMPPHVDLFAHLQPAREVGGDFYDFYLRDDELHFIIGDVSGKGIPASLFMAITRATFRFIDGMGLTPRETVSKINDSVSDGNDSGMFVTLFVGHLNLSTHVLTYCNAGHNPLLVMDGDGARFLDAKPNIVAGVMPGYGYVQQQCVLSADARLLLYTDGITEAERADKQQYGENRLLCWGTALPADVTSQQAAASLLADVQRFTAGADQNDDITVMIMRLLEG